MSNYDDVPYPDFIHPDTHPGNLAALGRLHGIDAAPPEQCRVLELACGPGGNLISLASLLPGSHFVGVDLAAGHIASGKATIAALGMTNVELHHGSILDWVAGPDENEQTKFDYIIAHGVYSWVPEKVRQAILAICQTRMSPNGIAIVSYNTYPGWHQRQMARDMMRYHAEGMMDPQARLRHGKALLHSVVQNVPESSAYKHALAEELHAIENANEAYVYHEQFEDTNRPRYFHQFAAEAASFRLQYVGEADWGDATYEQVRPDVAAALAALPKVRRAQTLDFFRRRTFRQSMLCQSDLSLTDSMNAGAISSFHFTTRSTLEGNQISGLNGLSGSVDHPATRAAIEHLIRIAPASATFEELLLHGQAEFAIDDSARETLQADLFDLVGVGLVETSASPTVAANVISAFPRASELARHQVSQGGTQPVTNRRHQSVRLDEGTSHLLSCCDGQTDHNGLIQKMTLFAIQSGGLIEGNQVVTGENNLKALVESKLLTNLQHLAVNALLVDG